MAEQVRQEDRKSKAAKMRAAGKSVREIAREFGVTRNSVLGMKHRCQEAGDARFGLLAKQVGRTPEEAAKARRVRSAERRERSDATAARRASDAGTRTPQRPRPPLGSDPGLGMPFQDVGSRQCHYVGADGYCAQPCGRASYRAKAATAYRPSAPVLNAGYRECA